MLFRSEIMKQFKWKEVAILSSTESLWSQVASFMKNETSRNSEFKVSYFHGFTPGFTTDEQFKEMLRSASQVAHGKPSEKKKYNLYK